MSRINLGALLKRMFQPVYHDACELLEKEADTVINAAIAAAKADPTGSMAEATLKEDLIAAFSHVKVNPLVASAAAQAVASFNYDATKYTGDAVARLTAYEADLNYHLDHAHL